MERILRSYLIQVLSDMGLPIDLVEVEVPKDERLGDLSTPLAMKLARSLKKPPLKIAEELRDRILACSRDNTPFERIEIAGQGFINFVFSLSALSSEFSKLLSEGNKYLREDLGKGKRVQIEFVSANPTGPLHLGHGRGAAIGMALANLLSEMGYKVHREYYINDAGLQVTKLAESLFCRFQQLKCNRPDFPFPEDGYKGDYLSELVDNSEVLRFAETNDLCNRSFVEVSEGLGDIACRIMLQDIKKDLSDFTVDFDHWQSERELYSRGLVQDALNYLAAEGLIYEHEGAKWFRSTDFGDDKDRVVIKQDGQFTYFASDIAYHKLKIDRGFEEIINVWGADHHGYIPRVSAVLKAMGLPADSFKVLLVQMVTLLRGGKPVQMSKRAGEFITLRELIDEIGPDTTKFLFLTRRHDTPLEIDVEKAKAQSSENPVYYVQYAHARLNSIIQKALSSGLDIQAVDDLKGLNEEELRLLKQCVFYPMLLRSSALTYEPHRITFYLQNLAGLFHHYYHKHRVITEDAYLTHKRLALCVGLKIVIKHGLSLLGVSAPERM